MKLMFVGVFDTQNRSTNNAQLRGFIKEGCEVIGFNFRTKAREIGSAGRDRMIVEVCREREPDLIVFSKCAEVSLGVFRECSSITTTCLWWMDPLSTLKENPGMIEKAAAVDIVCTAIKNTLGPLSQANENVHHILEGYDDMMHRPHNVEKDHEVTFIGSLHSERQRIIEQIVHPITHLNNVYAYDHAMAVSRSKINLNFSTAGAGSDRIYKVLGARGFLLTSDWEGREELFEDGKDLVIYHDSLDLNEKIKYYLENSDERDKIAAHGYATVQGMTKNAWAKRVVSAYKDWTENE